MASGLPPLPPGWTQHTAPTGHNYYYHASTKKSTYKRPADTPQQTPPTPQPAIQQPPVKSTALLVPKEHAVPLTEWTSEMSIESTYSQERPTARIMPNEMWKKLEDRPRKKADIPGAEPWVHITTKWHRTFYHNPTTGESYWKVPESIREIVERVQLETARANAAASESEEEEEEEDEYPDEADPADIPVEFTEEDIAYQLAQLQAEYGEQIAVDEEEEELDNDAKRQIFISLLEDKEINPFNTWESEMPKMVQDPRYSMVRNTKQRMDIFAEWARARIALIKEEKANVAKQDPKVGYLRLLADKGDPKEYWFEFRKKFRKAPEYKHWGTEKQKEDLWRDWCARKKMSREKREAELLSWMRAIKGTREEIMEKATMDVRYWIIGDEKDEIVRDALRGR